MKFQKNAGKRLPIPRLFLMFQSLLVIHVKYECHKVAWGEQSSTTSVL
ncbi:MAG: hypothetical protein V3W34_01590 [Phycisphaerae bacterium]